MGKFRVELSLQPGMGAIFFWSLVSIVFAFLCSSLIFLFYHTSPWEAYLVFFRGAFGSWYAFSETLKRAIPLLLVGTGLSLAFRAQVLNIGAEGQILLGAIAASWVALFSGVPPLLMLPLMFLLGFLGGGLWALVPALLKTRFAVNEVLTSLMLNYVAFNIVLYLIGGPWKGKGVRGFTYTDTFPEAGWLGTIGMTRVPYFTLIAGVVVAIAGYFFLKKAALGFELRIVGSSPETAKLLGISEEKVTLLVMFLSGGLAGFAGVGEVAGIHHLLRHPSHISLGYGYTAIIVAWLARANPLATILTAFLFGALISGGDALKVSLGIPFQVVSVVNGLILFFLISTEFLGRYRVVWRSSPGGGNVES
ncbi:MAG: ABC transporter permease [Candidatus Caldatribacteriaceae bacterium]